MGAFSTAPVSDEVAGEAAGPWGRRRFHGDANGFVTAAHFQLNYLGLFHQFDEFFDFS
jgi:hypothetical protein